MTTDFPLLTPVFKRSEPAGQFGFDAGWKKERIVANKLGKGFSKPPAEGATLYDISTLHLAPTPTKLQAFEYRRWDKKS